MSETTKEKHMFREKTNDKEKQKLWLHFSVSMI